VTGRQAKGRQAKGRQAKGRHAIGRQAKGRQVTGRQATRRRQGDRNKVKLNVEEYKNKRALTHLYKSMQSLHCMEHKRKMSALRTV
jgi:ribosome assembly protein YihI (activator of Der GTPase)